MHGCTSFPELDFSFVKPETMKLINHVYFNLVVVVLGIYILAKWPLNE
jgi:hypothetical protein